MIQKYKLRTSVVCINNGKILTFRGVDPSSKKSMFFLPGGKPKKKENLIDCAIRETLEETGYKIIIANKSSLIKEYKFLWNQVEYNCETYFFYGDLIDKKQSKVIDKDYNKGVEWIDIHKIDEVFNYNQDILNVIKKMLFEKEINIFVK